MKMVAAAGLRRAQGLIGKSSAYYDNLLISVQRVIFDLKQEEAAKGVRYLYPKMMTGSGKDHSYLLLVVSSDKGLCGSYNANVAKAALKRIDELLSAGHEVKVVCIGKKARDVIKRKHADLIVRTGGEMRLSNFLLWQSAYSELFFSDTLWPDFTTEEVDVILEEFRQRNRRYGGI